ncbi:MAG: hypothetical protein EF806_02500 [Candidatus Methanoliparum thermophilum]|uniref:Amidohydrolase-related domain-containing protein n=1 Tax=Methanoliparum thermophilum TaxID=2491083 RepID=A0A520KSP5_METT2|nr:amidohydrolase family protein [Candidatus Methanoliparum sp. LAM-1]RZN64932.1 MAG: hypothetical protein EF806_02500 [Candidatus Methanoliparum thermophilum]BDC36188.1 chlorohydrolase [Candidatus Methanoliparum sp. LAM-1]
MKKGHEVILNGTILTGEDLDIVKGNLIVREGKIRRIEESTVGSEIIIPSFINAHTHLGDSFAKDIPFKNLREAVTPPDGLKHKLLNITSEHIILESMKESIIDMVKCGTGLFMDFREGGITGLNLLKKALSNSIDAFILGRPVNEKEIDEILKKADGIGMSSTNDHEEEYLIRCIEHTKKFGKKFAIHAGELDDSDIDPAIDLGADILIHLTHADKKQLKKIKDLGITVVVCPRSNFVTGVGIPPIKNMLDLGIDAIVGTDNVMFNSLNIFSELEFISKIFYRDNDKNVLKMATSNINRLLKDHGTISEGGCANLMVIDGGSPNLNRSKDLYRSIVRRARPDDIKMIIHKNTVLKKYF